MRKDSNIGLVVGLGLVLGGAIYFWPKNKTPKTRITEPRYEAPIPTKGVITETPTSAETSPVEAQKALSQLRMKAAEADIMNLKVLAFKKEDDARTIPFQFEAKKVWCQAGDLDTMAAAGDASANDILVSIESLSGDSVASLRTSVNTLKAGLSHTFKMQDIKANKAYSLSICSDSRKQGKCSGKTVTSHAQISAAAAQGKTAKVDYLYFFQPIILSEKSIQLFDSTNVSEAYQGRVNQVLSKKFAWSQTDIGAATKRARSTGSVPAEIEGDKIVVKLPYNDPKCSSGPASIR